MKKKILTGMLAAVLAAGSFTVPIFAAGWEQDASGYWYVYDNGKYPTSRIAAIDGVNYGFDESGYMVKGWFYHGKDWYYFDPATGAQMTGWLQLDGKWYYLDPDNAGKMKTSWLDQGRNRYYLNANGEMLTGAFVVDGYYYFAEADGSLRRSTTESEDGITIHYDSDGKQWYKSNETVLYGASGGDVWLPVLEDNDLLSQRINVQESNEDYISEVEDELYEQFKKDLSKTTGQTKMLNSISKWKDKARRRLEKLSMTSQEIDQYITSVVEAQYNGDEGSWEYTYDEKNSDGSITSRSYRYWWGDADDDFDSDDDDDDWEYW